MPSFYGRRGVAVASAAALAVVILGLVLGFWQLRRADEKAELQRRLDQAATVPALELAQAAADARRPGLPALTAPAEVDGQRVQASGTFLPERSIFLDNRTREAVAGFHVLTPLKLAGGERHVMVLRGWVARDPIVRDRLPQVPTPRQPVRVAGMAVAQLQQPMMLAEEPPPGPGDQLWQHFSYARFSAWAGIELYPVILRQTVEPAYQDGLARDWNQPGTSVDRHRAYAFQWFSMTAVAIGIWLLLLWRNRSGPSRSCCHD